jgi:hypothetical protein
MIFRFDARKTSAITYGPMLSAFSPHREHPNSSYFEEIHVERTA